MTGKTWSRVLSWNLPASSPIPFNPDPGQERHLCAQRLIFLCLPTVLLTIQPFEESHSYLVSQFLCQYLKVCSSTLIKLSTVTKTGEPSRVLWHWSLTRYFDFQHPPPSPPLYFNENLPFFLRTQYAFYSRGVFIYIGLQFCQKQRPPLLLSLHVFTKMGRHMFFLVTLFLH